MKKKILNLLIPAVAAAAMTGAGGTQAVGLEGATVTLAGYCCTAPIESNRGTTFATATVGAGIEFPEGSLRTLRSGDILIGAVTDISANQIDSRATVFDRALSGTFNGTVLTFTGAGVPSILNVTLDPLSTYTPIGISFTANSISVNNAGLFFSPSSRLVLDITTAPVPEPETYLLMLAGLAILGTIAKRRSS